MIKQIIIALLFATICSADGKVIGWPVAGGSSAIYYAAGSDSYTTPDYLEGNGTEGQLFADDITITTGGSLTSVGFKAQSGTISVKIGVYTGGPTWTLHEQAVITNPIAGWNDVTLAAPLTVSSAQVVRVAILSAVTQYVYSNVASGGYDSGGATYANAMWSTLIAMNSTSWSVGMRANVQ